MKAFILLLCLLPLSALANWQADVTLGVDGETFKAEQAKFAEDKETVLKLGRYQLKLTLKTNKQEEGLDVSYVVEEKKGDKLTLVNKGSEIIEAKDSADIYAKGETGQPNSIITFKFKK